MNFRAAVLLVASTSAFAWAQAHAQESAPQDETADAGDIVVTATRRSEVLSDVPIAVSAVSGETLERSGASDVRQLTQVAPSLLVSGATSEVNFTARIRGIGTVGENAGLESSVGLFIDGVYRSRTGAGLPIASQRSASQAPSNSPNIWEISGAVVKSPAAPTGVAWR